MLRKHWIAAALALACSGSAGAVGRLVDLSVYDRTEGRQLAVHWHQGRAYVAGQPGNEYRVTLRNRLGEQVLAVVSVDGVNVVTGETARPDQTGYVLSPRRAYGIQGWRKSLAETAAFYFTALPDSYAARTGRPDDVGVIGVAVFRQKRAAPPPPAVGRSEPRPAAPAEDAQARSSAGSSMAERDYQEDRLGTGHGRREASQVREVRFERSTPTPVETVTLYYDSYRNLVAMGVIREPAHVSPRLPQPRPFPGFVPDPHTWQAPLPYG